MISRQLTGTKIVLLRVSSRKGELTSVVMSQVQFNASGSLNTEESSGFARDGKLRWQTCAEACIVKFRYQFFDYSTGDEIVNLMS